MTLKKAILRGLVGVPIGVTISYAITILISLGWGGGQYAPVVPALADAVGTEISAVALQFCLSCLMGFVFAFASAIWEIEHWSLTRQTVCHFLSISLGALPIAWICHWADQIPGGILGYFAIFAAIYAVLWLGITASIRRRVRAVNQQLNKRKQS